MRLILAPQARADAPAPMKDIEKNRDNTDETTTPDSGVDNRLDQEIKDLIEQSELKSGALKKMINKLNETKKNDPGQ